MTDTAVDARCRRAQFAELEARTFDIAVIGGGITGAGIARDAAMRGLRVVLVEQGDIGAGTSGRFHSMLQSGSRYVLTDVAYAAECMRERRIIGRTAPFAFEKTDEKVVQAFALRKDSGLVEVIDEALGQLAADGTLAEIGEKYFGQDISK